MRAEQKERRANGEADVYQAEVMEKIRGIHSTVGEIKTTLTQTHRLTAEIHDQVTKKEK